jgi:hypothetical protein
MSSNVGPRRLPRELHCQIFEFLPLAEQRKLITLSRCIHAKFDKQLKTKLAKIAEMKKNKRRPVFTGQQVNICQCKENI